MSWSGKYVRQESLANRQHFHTKSMLAEPKNVRYSGRGRQGGNAALKAMLTYMQDSREENVTDEATAELHDYVSRTKVMPEVKDAYIK